jgi:hypothetical protein
MHLLSNLRAVTAALVVTLGFAFMPFAAPVQGIGPAAALADYHHRHQHCAWQWRHHHRVRVCSWR